MPPKKGRDPLAFLAPTAPIEETYLEYQVEEEIWRIDQWPSLAKATGLAAAEVADWHRAVAGNGRGWTICSMVYGIAPLLDPFLPMKLPDVAERLGIPLGETRESLRAFLHLNWKAGETTEDEGWTRPGEQEEAAIPPLRPDDYNEAQARELLKGMSTDGMLNEDMETALTRAWEFKGLRSDRNAWPLVMNLIRMEVDVAYFDRQVNHLRRQLEGEDNDSPGFGKRSESLTKLMSSRNDLMTAHMGLLDKIMALGGAEGGDPSQLRNCLGDIVHAIQKYRQDGSRDLIDGLHTAAEIKLLCTPHKERPPQYRPDVAYAAYLAGLDLFGKQPPPGVDAEIARKLQQGITAALEDDHAGTLLRLGWESSAVAPEPEGDTTDDWEDDEAAESDEARAPSVLANEAGETAALPSVLGGGATGGSTGKGEVDIFW